MDIGRLNKRVTFCRYEEEENELGQMQQVLQEICTVWATVEPKSGSEYIEADKERPKLYHNVTIRYRPGITEDMYVRHKERMFSIQSIRNPEESNQMLVISCTEKKDEKREVSK